MKKDESIEKIIEIKKKLKDIGPFRGRAVMLKDIKKRLFSLQRYYVSDDDPMIDKLYQATVKDFKTAERILTEKQQEQLEIVV
jgi:hypothetical protein